VQSKAEKVGTGEASNVALLTTQLNYVTLVIGKDLEGGFLVTDTVPSSAWRIRKFPKIMIALGRLYAVLVFIVVPCILITFRILFTNKCTLH
jgi:hypothetical protein